MRRLGGLGALAIVALGTIGAGRSGRSLETFDALEGWSGMHAPGASVELAQDTGLAGNALRLDFDLRGGRGWVIARKALDVALPANYAFRFWVRGAAEPNNLEFKIVGPDGSVWWNDEPDFSFPPEWRQVTIRKSRMRFAWGPGGDAPLERVAYIEFAISTGAGGTGSIWLDDLTLDEREPDHAESLKPAVTASTSVEGEEPMRAADGSLATRWLSGEIASEQWLLLDFGRPRDYGGLVIDWDRDDYATAYEVAASDDGRAWTPIFTATSGNGGRDYVFLADTESRYVRLTLGGSSRGKGYGVAEIVVKPIAFSASTNRFFKEIAGDAPPGTYPRYLLGEQSFWTVVGVAGDDKEALLNEEGTLEVDERAFSIEPFLYTRGALVTWKDVERTPALERGYLPLPSVTWRRAPLTLRIAAFAAGEPGASTLYATYQLANDGAAPEEVSLFLALRPFQVLPPWQSLNVKGGTTPIRDLRFATPTAWVNGERAVIALTPPDGFGAATFGQGLVTDFLAAGRLPIATAAIDTFGYAEAAFEYRMTIAPGERRDVHLAVPFHDPAGASERLLAAGSHVVGDLRATTVAAWEHVLARIEIDLPPAAPPLVDTLKTTLAYALIHRDGPAIQPGSRTYGRSWIRDGAFIAATLLRSGFTEEVRDYLKWFAGYQLVDGRIPCCVDRRGAETVPEHDSNGEFIYAVAEYYRFTRDIGFVFSMWPAVTRAVDSITSLRAERMTPLYQQPENEAFYGLLPASISHEGYSGHPVHSYWDDFLALRGLGDAVDLAAVVGDEARAVSTAALRDALRRDLYASIAKTIARRGLDYLPASADLGDLDPNSTAIAVVPGSELPYLPQAPLLRTFERYYEELQRRVARRPSPEEGYTPYELRNVGVFVRLGQRERAYEVLQTLFADRRPAAWNEWQEIVWRDPTAPRFIGDMPHVWAAAAFVTGLRDMLAYEREEDDALVLAAGVPAAWMADPPGIAVERLPTHYGVLSYALVPEGPRALRMAVGGDLSVPRGGIVVRPPLPGPLIAAMLNGEPLRTFDPDGVTLTAVPADLLLEY